MISMVELIINLDTHLVNNLVFKGYLEDRRSEISDTVFTSDKGQNYIEEFLQNLANFKE